METFPWLDWTHILTQDRALSYFSTATDLRSIWMLDLKLFLFYWRVVRLPREMKLSKIWRSVDRQQNLGVTWHWCQKMDIAYFINDLGPEVTTYYQNTHGRPKTIFMCFLCCCWRLHFLYFILFIVLGEKKWTLSESCWLSFGFIIDFYHLIHLFILWFSVTIIMFK